MPYVILKNPAFRGVLHLTDLLPNASQRNTIYQPTQGTKYPNYPDLGTPTTVSGTVTKTTTTDSSGLCAYFLSRVSDGSGTIATASITTVAKANLVDGDFLVLRDGVRQFKFEFNVSGSHQVLPGLVFPNVVEVNVSADTTADDVRDTLIEVINSTTLTVTASIGGAATVNLTNDNQNISAASQNATNSESVADGGFAITSFAGATPSSTLGSSGAETNAQDVLTQAGIGSATSGGSLALSDLNGALTSGTLTQSQVTEILQIMDGRAYKLDAGSTVEAAGEFSGGSGEFDEDVLYIPLYESGSFQQSVAEGVLSAFGDDEYSVDGAAVLVYADNGTRYL